MSGAGQTRPFASVEPHANFTPMSRLQSAEVAVGVEPKCEELTEENESALLQRPYAFWCVREVRKWANCGRARRGLSTTPTTRRLASHLRNAPNTNRS
jgi:hypothetical protein